MRILVVTLLTGLILACPFVCGSDEVGHSAKHQHATGGSGSGDAPDQCPESSDNCVCRGALQSSAVRAATPDADASAPFFLTIPLHSSGPLHHHLTWEGSPTGLSGWGDSLTIRALLQNFRC